MDQPANTTEKKTPAKVIGTSTEIAVEGPIGMLTATEVLARRAAFEINRDPLHDPDLVVVPQVWHCQRCGKPRGSIDPLCLRCRNILVNAYYRTTRKPLLSNNRHYPVYRVRWSGSQVNCTDHSIELLWDRAVRIYEDYRDNL